MFIVTWLFNKLGYMPKINMEVGKVQIDTKTPEFKMWPFPVLSEDFDPRPKKKPAALNFACSVPWTAPQSRLLEWPPKRVQFWSVAISNRATHSTRP